MSVTTVYAAEVLNVIAERRDLELFTGTPIFIHNGVDEELVGWLGCPLPTNGYPCEHMGMGDEGSTACWSATEINRLREENNILRKLVAEIYEDQCDDGDQWKYRDRIRELGIKF